MVERSGREIACSSRASIAFALTPDHMHASMTSTMLFSHIAPLSKVHCEVRSVAVKFRLVHLDALPVPMSPYLCILIGNLHARSKIDRLVSGVPRD